MYYKDIKEYYYSTFAKRCFLARIACACKLLQFPHRIFHFLIIWNLEEQARVL